VGGVGIDEARDYLDAGACAVGIGSPLLCGADRDADGEALDALTVRARTLLDKVNDRVNGPLRTEEVSS
jgi:2-dehydro-3-deoxyphosphogluconate aldolase/(4S)-4-hydroxy-2-oxoglutarate aldolase